MLATLSDDFMPVLRPTVYVETSVVSYLTAKTSRDVVRLARQQLTREWWERRSRFELVVSYAVIDEAGRGDRAAAELRVAALEGLLELPLTEAVLKLADQLIAEHALPAKAQVDALHIAVAAVHGVNYLLTWNCRHIANAARREDIERTCENAGHRAPIICTPDELAEEDEDGNDG
jgi:predicted nucleic acid-binding protein